MVDRIGGLSKFFPCNSLKEASIGDVALRVLQAVISPFAWLAKGLVRGAQSLRDRVISVLPLRAGVALDARRSVVSALLNLPPELRMHFVRALHALRQPKSEWNQAAWEEALNPQQGARKQVERLLPLVPSLTGYHLVETMQILEDVASLPNDVAEFASSLMVNKYAGLCTDRRRRQEVIAQIRDLPEKERVDVVKQVSQFRTIEPELSPHSCSVEKVIEQFAFVPKDLRGMYAEWAGQFSFRSAEFCGCMELIRIHGGLSEEEKRLFISEIVKVIGRGDRYSFVDTFYGVFNPIKAKKSNPS